MNKISYKSVLAPYMDRLLKMKQSIGFSVSSMKYTLKNIDNFALKQRLQNPHINASFVDAWRQTLIADSEATLYHKYSVLSQLTKLMCRNGCECFIPQLPKHPSQNFKPYIFTEDQIRQIFEETDKSRVYDSCMDRALIAMPALLRLLYSTGVRISEALSIRNKDLHLHERFILLRNTKNKRERIVPVCESLSEVLSQYIAYRNKMPLAEISLPESLLFVKANGTGFSRDTAYYFFKKILEKCNIPHIGNGQGGRVHDLRHTYAVHTMVQIGRLGIDLHVMLPALSTCLGHRSTAETEQYLHLTFAMYPELEQQCSPINAYVYPQINKDK